ncbi:mediator of RNA polymerase II transcription subunit 28 [Galendromus occidentalis]|uniref:Mediator of RNA polymerase II transcription subunit 28 n=1 Tax=Galendromus occidentalis TaxID=34638 RepID=A0AAJ6QR30_9ACAR|nr:mediator of RNA polymerase II transcription subunit 28 [Galendromus occidentalis]
MALNLAEELETAFHSCIAATTNNEYFAPRDNGDEIKVTVEQTVRKFLDTARQMECFFLQKRLLVSPQKPEQIVMEDNMELKNELMRKEQLLEKYHAKLIDWQRLVSDTSIGSGAPPHNMPMAQQRPSPQQPPIAAVAPMSAGYMCGNPMNPAMQMQGGPPGRQVGPGGGFRGLPS